jgi:hypothetical protein
MMDLIADRRAERLEPVWISRAIGLVVCAFAMQIFRKRDY